MDREEKKAPSLRAQAREMLNSLDLTSMETLVSHLNSPDDSERSTATRLFEFCANEYANAQSLKLSHLFQSCPRFETRIQSGTLFHSLLIHPWYSFHRISPMILTDIKLAFMDCLRQENTEPLSKMTCEIISVVAKNIFDNDKDWPELSDYAIDHIESDTKHIQELTILVLAEMPPSLGKKSIPHVDRLHSTLLRRLESSDSSIRGFAISASANLVREMPHTFYHQLEDLLPAMIKVVFEFLNDGQEVYAQKGLKELVVPAVEFIELHLNYVFNSMIQIAENEAFTEQTRYDAVKVLSALNDACEMVLLQKLPHDIIRSLFSVLMRMLTVIQDDPAWDDVNNEDGVDAGKSETYDLGAYMLDQLSVALDEDVIMAIALEQVPAYLAAPEWQKHFAGITALALTVEGFFEVTENLNQVVTTALDLFQDPHPRVRWAAINAIMSLTIGFGPNFQDQFYQLILPALVAATGDSQNPRVQAHAAVTMLFFCKDCTPNILTPYLAEIVGTLCLLLQNGNQVLQEQALVILVAVASSSQDQFQMHYDEIIPFLKVSLLNATDTSQRTLRAKSVECISSIVMAVGKDKFQEDARQVIEIVMSVQGSLIEGDHDTQINILQALFRFCKCLGSEFFPYTGVLMPTLLQIARLGSDIKKITVDSGAVTYKFNQSSGRFSEGIEEINILKEKALACTMLTCCATQLKEKFFPWIDQVIDTMIPLVNFHHTETRLAAVYAMPALLCSAKLTVENKGRSNSYIQKLVLQVVPALVEALSKEQEKEIWTEVLKSLTGCIEISGSLFTKAQVKLIVNEIKWVLTAGAADNFDWAKEEGKEEIFSQVGDCLCMLIKRFKDNFSPFFDELLPYITDMLGNDKTARQKPTAFCIFNDVVQQSQEAALKYCDIYFPFLLQACKDENPIVQQEAVRGIGVYTEFGGAKFNSSAEEAVSSLNAINSNNARAYEMAVSALGKVCEFHHDRIDAAQVFSVWLSYLPLRNDFVLEAKRVHEQLCSMLEKSDKELLGPDNINLPKFLEVISKILKYRNILVTEETSEKMAALLERYTQL